MFSNCSENLATSHHLCWYIQVTTASCPDYCSDSHFSCFHPCSKSIFHRIFRVILWKCMSLLAQDSLLVSYFTWDINSNSLQWLFYLPDPFSFSSPPSLLGSTHTGLLSVPWTQCACSCLRTFIISISPSRNALPSDICRIFSFCYNPNVSLIQGSTYSDYLI